MKRLICLITLFSIFLNFHSNAEINHFSKSKEAFSLNAFKKISNKTTVFKAKFIYCDAANTVSDWHKKRNRKGTRPVFAGIRNKFVFVLNSIDNKAVLSGQAAYCFRSFPSNEKRGPPFYFAA